MPPRYIMDLAYNQLIDGTIVQAIGYVEEEDQGFSRRNIYDFVFASIREQDRENTNLLKRYLEAPQQVWNAIHEKIFSVLNLWDITEIDDEYLKYMQSIVGWTGELTKITEALDYDTLRRLISISISLWKNRGPEDIIISVLSLTTQARSVIFNWFDFRWILEETAITEDHQGRDSYILNLPGSGDEYLMNLRIVDNGTLDKELVINLVKLMRPVGETFIITYVSFLELFSIDDDDVQWTTRAGDLIVSNGMALLEDDSVDEEIYATEGVSLTGQIWDDQDIYSRIKVNITSSSLVGIEFRSDGTGDNFYRVSLDTLNNDFVFYKRVGGIDQPQTIVDYTPWGAFYNNIWYGIRIVVQADQIKIYIDNSLILEAADSSFSSGTFGFYHEPNSTIEIDEAEMILLPASTDVVGINS